MTLSDVELRLVVSMLEAYYADHPDRLACSDPGRCRACTFLKLRAARDGLTSQRD